MAQSDGKNVAQIVAGMTLDEKIDFIAGRDFWKLADLQREGIPQIMVTDGPSGLRKQVADTDMLGLNESVNAISFPTGSATACSFDPRVTEKVGDELGKIALAQDVAVVLGPALNIKRSPLCGRNFEYYSEDPLLSGKLAAGHVRGQQNRGVGACPKHFCANNQEYFRLTSNSVIDQQTLREIYLPAFETTVKESAPWSIMCSYNKLNGTYMCQNAQLLTDILRTEWGFDGMVVTDWSAMDDPVLARQAGLDLEMPGPATANALAVRQAVESGQLSQDDLDKAVANIITLIVRCANDQPAQPYDLDAGHEVAKEVELACAVLLKNDGDLLPLSPDAKIAVIGKMAQMPRYQGGGSSHVNPYKVTSFMEVAEDLPGLTYCDGYTGGDRQDDDAQATRARLLEEAVDAAAAAQVAVVFAGLPDAYESEGYDRKGIDMPEEQNQLIAAVADAQPNTVVVLHNGSPIAMPWLDKVAAVLEMYLGGEAVGAATADLVFGRANPSGRLAETFPLRIEDNPAYPYYGVERHDVVYREGRLVGYRWYQTMQRPVLFPFGHGLSYTTFQYSNLDVDVDGNPEDFEMTQDDTLTVSVDVTNTGSRAGVETVQLYVRNAPSQQVRPLRELRAFDKVQLEPGQTKTVKLSLDMRAFACWDEQLHGWSIPRGTYGIEIGRSSQQIELSSEITVRSSVKPLDVFTRNTPLSDIVASPAGQKVLGSMGGMLAKIAQGPAPQDGGDEAIDRMMAEMLMTMPLRSVAPFIPDCTREQLDELVDELNAAAQEK